MTTFDLTIQEMAKIEGKASLSVKVRDGNVEELHFAISEYKRFYTQAIKGADVAGVAQLTARICGTCSNAHILCTIKTVERALGITATQQTMLLRELLNWGLNIRDHALHLYVFSLPDILGVDNILEVDEKNEDHRQLLEDCFAVKAVGNMLGKCIGGRSVHAPTPTVGGFMMMPKIEQFPEIIKGLYDARPRVLRLIEVYARCGFALHRDAEFAALIDDRLSFLGGEILATDGKKIPESEFGNHLEHVVIPYSHASGYKFGGKVYMVGALARINLGKDHLHPNTRRDASAALVLFPSKNIYHNNLAQAIEILHAIDSSIQILEHLTLAKEMLVAVVRKKAEGVGVIEAPRGTLYYKLAISEEGKIEHADIVVPTGQNQIGIEQSLLEYFREHLSEGKDVLEREAEKIVRAYDPCMSCASHFLTVEWIEKK